MARDLTAAEFTAISARYGPYDALSEFWDGYSAYWNDTGRYRCPHDYHSVPGQAWRHGHDAAMHVRWQCKLPARDEYELDDRDSAKMCRGLEAGIERMRKNGTLPPRRPRPNELRPIC
jgi:hypothetical protein